MDVYCNYCSDRVCTRWSGQVGGQRSPILGQCPPRVSTKVSRILEAPAETLSCTLDGCLPSWKLDEAQSAPLVFVIDVGVNVEVPEAGDGDDHVVHVDAPLLVLAFRPCRR
ncbi:hypothetical protein KM043_015538 [Ampulex compressa]|nr:hypothetical protein KM043_015538 [Ampulex compressa]